MKSATPGTGTGVQVVSGHLFLENSVIDGWATGLSVEAANAKIEMHNNTGAEVSVTLRGYDSAGVMQSGGVMVTIPAEATVFRTAADIGVPIETFAGVVIIHSGAYGAISANLTTLNGATGLSFDSPFTVRDGLMMRLPVR